MADKKKEEVDDTRITDTDLQQAVDTATGSIVEQADDDGTTVHRDYDHADTALKINKVCGEVLEKLLKFNKPYKYIVVATSGQKSDAIIHTVPSVQYGQADLVMVSKRTMITDWLWIQVTVFCLQL